MFLFWPRRVTMRAVLAGGFKEVVEAAGLFEIGADDRSHSGLPYPPFPHVSPLPPFSSRLSLQAVCVLSCRPPSVPWTARLREGPPRVRARARAAAEGHEMQAAWRRETRQVKTAKDTHVGRATRRLLAGALPRARPPHLPLPQALTALSAVLRVTPTLAHPWQCLWG